MKAAGLGTPVGEDVPENPIAGKLVKAVEETLARGDVPYLTISGTPNAAVKYPDGTYKTKPLVGGEEFQLTGMRHGKRVPFLMIFTPVDARDYESMEMSAEDVCEASPELRGWFSKALTDQEDLIWPEIVRTFRENLDRKEEEKLRAKEEKEKRKLEKKQEIYSLNEDWGSF
jgi:hypothetical protein